MDTRVAATVAERFEKVAQRQLAPGSVVAAVQAADDLDRRTRGATTLTSLNVIRVTAAASGHSDASDAIAGHLDTLAVDSQQLLAVGAPALPATLSEPQPAQSASMVIDGTFQAVAQLEATAATPSALAGTGPGVGPSGVRVDATGLQSRLVDALAPEPNAGRRAAARAIVPDRVGDPLGLDPVMSAPDLPAPLALGLLVDGPDWFLPGLGDFPPDRVRLLAANDEFIEAFMVGANHEFNRELLWREYPTDQRGTPFRVFWPRPAGGTDIPPIAEFTAGNLGTHLSQGAGHLSVLLVRAELLRRFPQTQVFAAPAAGSPGALTLDLDTRSWKPPVFVIPIDPATTAYAFDIDADELQAEAAMGAPGWFFCSRSTPTGSASDSTTRRTRPSTPGPT